MGILSNFWNFLTGKSSTAPKTDNSLFTGSVIDKVPTVQVPALENPGYNVTPSDYGGASTPALLTPKTGYATFKESDVQPISAQYQSVVPKPGAQAITSAPVTVNNLFSSLGTPTVGGTNMRSLTPPAPVPAPVTGLNFSPYITPPRGLEGTSGQSNASFGSNFSSAPQATSGASGFGGSSNFTGTLGAVGGAGGAQPISEMTDEQKRRLYVGTGGETTTALATPPPGFNYLPTGQIVAPSGPFRIQSFNAAPAFNVNKTATPINVTQAKTVAETTQNLPLGAQKTAQDLIGELTTRRDELLAKVNAQNPTPSQPVIPTPEQETFIQESPSDIRARLQTEMDNFRLNGIGVQGGLPALENGRIDVMKQIQAANEAYEAIVKDIRDNPDLPKSLAKKRIEEFTRVNGIATKNLIGQLDIINQQIKDANDRVNEHFGIVKEAESEARQVTNDAQQFLSLQISSKGISNMSDQQLKNAAKAAGWSYESLKAIQKAVTSKGSDVTNVTTQVDQNGNVSYLGLDINNKPVNLGTINNVGKPSTGGNTFTTTQLNKGAANAGVPIDTFKSYSVDAQNYFINNGTALKKFLDAIATYKKDGESRQDVLDAINTKFEGSEVPVEVKDKVMNYFNTLYPAPAPKVPAAQQKVTPLWKNFVDWWNS